MSLNPNFLHFPMSLQPSPFSRSQTELLTCCNNNISKSHFLFSFTKLHSRFQVQNAASKNKERGNVASGFQKFLGKRVGFIEFVLPSDSWRSLSEGREDDAKVVEEPTVLALRPPMMWELVADE